MKRAIAYSLFGLQMALGAILATVVVLATASQMTPLGGILTIDRRQTDTYLSPQGWLLTTSHLADEMVAQRSWFGVLEDPLPEIAAEAGVKIEQDGDQILPGLWYHEFGPNTSGFHVRHWALAVPLAIVVAGVWWMRRKRRPQVEPSASDI